MPKSKYLNNKKQTRLRDVLNKYEFLFYVKLGTWKKRPVDIELQQGDKPYHDKPYPVSHSHKALLR